MVKNKHIVETVANYPYALAFSAKDIFLHKFLFMGLQKKYNTVNYGRLPSTQVF